MKRPNPDATILLGLVCVLLSAIGLAVQNVISRIYFVPSLLFGHITFGGFLPTHIGNIILLLAMRMAMMAMLLALMAPALYPKTFIVLRQLPQSPRLLKGVLGSSLSLFISLICLYSALSQIAAGIAIAIFFIYPAVTVLLAWRFFDQRLGPYKLWLMIVILLGVVFTTLTTGSANNTLPGMLSAAGAGLSFGIYGILAESCLQHQPSHPALHPIPFSLSTFIIVSGLAALTLPIIQPVDIAPSTWITLLAMTLLSAALTLIAYVLNNFGIRYIGASLSALISASTPAFTALFAWWVLQETLQPQQIVGIGLVTLGVSALSLSTQRKHDP